MAKKAVRNSAGARSSSKSSPTRGGQAGRRRVSKKSASRRTREPDAKEFGPKSEPGLQRLNKVLAAAGLGSRREVEDFIIEGRVEVNREIVTNLSLKVNPAEVTIKFDGQTLKKFRPVYFALNKPKGVLSTNKDPSGRMRVVDLVPDRDRVFSVGRLDRNSEGLMLLTNDGDLAQRLAHPRYRVQKAYFVVVAGMMTNEELAKLRKGVYLAEGMARIDGATIKKHRKGCTEVEIVLSEGKNREIRRILARAGHKVVVLRRIAIGSLRLGTLPVGASRVLTATEVKQLYLAAVPIAKKTDTANKKTAKKKTGGKAAAVVASASSTSAKPSSEARPPVKPKKARPERIAPELDDDMDDELGSELGENDFGFQTLGDDELIDFSDEDFGSFAMAADDAADDEFIGDFSGTGGLGSVVGGDEPESKPTRRRATKKSASGGSRSPRGSGSTKRAGTKTGSTKRADSKTGRSSGAHGGSVTRKSAGGSSGKSSTRSSGKPSGDRRSSTGRGRSASSSAPRSNPSGKRAPKRGGGKGKGRGK